MQKNVKKQEMNNNQLFWLAIRTSQWWNAVIFQAERFFDALEIEHGGTPWDKDDTNSRFTAERMFLIVSLHHAIECLQKMNIELQRSNDTTFQAVVKEIEKVASLEDIKDLRDMNEHIMDYSLHLGRKQGKLVSEKTIDDKVYTESALWTHQDHDNHRILIGTIEINRLIDTIKTQLPIVQQKTKEIFDRELNFSNS